MSTYLTKLHEKTDKYSIAYKHFIVSWKSKNSYDDRFHFSFHRELREMLVPWVLEAVQAGRYDQCI